MSATVSGTAPRPCAARPLPRRPPAVARRRRRAGAGPDARRPAAHVVAAGAVRGRGGVRRRPGPRHRPRQPPAARAAARRRRPARRPVVPASSRPGCCPHAPRPGPQHHGLAAHRPGRRSGGPAPGHRRARARLLAERPWRRCPVVSSSPSTTAGATWRAGTGISGWWRSTPARTAAGRRRRGAAVDPWTRRRPRRSRPLFLEPTRPGPAAAWHVDELERPLVAAGPARAPRRAETSPLPYGPVAGLGTSPTSPRRRRHRPRDCRRLAARTTEVVITPWHGVLVLTGLGR